MPKEAIFTLKIEPELRADFMAEADAVHRPASQIVRDLMREFIDRQRGQRDYEAFLRGKVESAREAADQGLGRSNEEVEAEFAARRAKTAEAV